VPEHPVVSTRDATTVAPLDSLVIDPERAAVTDVEFDPVTGSVVSVIGTNGTVPGDLLVGCGSYAVVVRNP
jgi:hypothetical protein